MRSPTYIYMKKLVRSLCTKEPRFSKRGEAFENLAQVDVFKKGFLRFRSTSGQGTRQLS